MTNQELIHHLERKMHHFGKMITAKQVTPEFGTGALTALTELIHDIENGHVDGSGFPVADQATPDVEELAAHVTPGEAAVMEAIAINEMNSANYSEPDDASGTCTWLWTLPDGAYQLRPGQDADMPTGKALDGTIGSLTKKGLVTSDLQPDYKQGRDIMNDSTIQLTPLGFEVWKFIRK